MRSKRPLKELSNWILCHRIRYLMILSIEMVRVGHRFATWWGHLNDSKRQLREIISLILDKFYNIIILFEYSKQEDEINSQEKTSYKIISCTTSCHLNKIIIPKGDNFISKTDAFTLFATRCQIDFCSIIARRPTSECWLNSTLFLRSSSKVNLAMIACREDKKNALSMDKIICISSTHRMFSHQNEYE